MSKRLLIAISCGITLLMVIYMGYDTFIYRVSDNTLSDFLDTYINNPQKYLFNGMIYSIPLIYATAIRFANAELLIRMKSKLLYIITEESIITSVKISTYVMMLHIVTAYLNNLAMDFNIEIVNIFFRLIIFYMQCHFLYYLLYSISTSPIASLVIVVFINMLVLLIILSLGFVYINSVQTNLLQMFILYECISCIFAYFALTFVLKKKEFVC